MQSSFADYMCAMLVNLILPIQKVWPVLQAHLEVDGMDKMIFVGID